MWKFMLIDGLAAIISVPTQVYFVATYGEIILNKIAEFKLIVLAIFGGVLVMWLIRKVYLKNVRKNL